MEQKTLQVEGMSCQHCVKAVETSVGELDGVSAVHVIWKRVKSMFRLMLTKYQSKILRMR